MTDILVIAGLSGAGRSQAADNLEDLGWFVVDNVPVVLIDKVVELSGEAGGEVDKLCLVVGAVQQQTGVLAVVHTLRAAGHRVRILFLEASTRELVSRYEATRRRHPFSDRELGLESLIEKERRVLEEVRAAADVVIDTTGVTVHQLKTQLLAMFGPESPSDAMQLSVMSFGYKFGLPLDVDIVLDARFLPNPHWNEQLRPLSGIDDAVSDYVLNQPLAKEFLVRVESLLELILPAYVDEGRSYLSIAIGCTGGRHRSVALAEMLGTILSKRGFQPRITHRDMTAH